MKKIIILLAAIIAVGTCTFTSAQTIHRSQWGGQPRLRTNSLFISGVLTMIENSVLSVAGAEEMNEDEYAEFYKKYSWFVPEVSTSYHIPGYKFTAPNEKVTLHAPYWWREIFLWGDYSHDLDISAGYELNWKSLTTPFGAYIAADYEFRQLHMRINDGEAHRIKSQAIIPSAGIRLHFGSFEHLVRPLLSVGAGYVYNLKYKGPEGNSLDVLNNGVRGMASIGVEFTKMHTSLVLEYQYDFYKYYNEDYTPDNGVTFPHEGWDNTFGTLAVRLSHAF